MTEVTMVCTACTRKIHRLLLDVDTGEERWYHVEDNSPLCDKARPAAQGHLPLILDSSLGVQ